MNDDLELEDIASAVQTLADFMGVDVDQIPEHLIHPVTGAPWNFHKALGIVHTYL